jgi:putative transposase
MAQSRRKTKRKPKPLGTIWELPDPLWERIKPILLEFWPKKPTGRRVANWRLALNGIIFRMRTGCQWEQLPRKFGPKSTVHGWFQRWCSGGVMKRIWEELVRECDELGAVDWEWQSADGWLGKARFGGEKDGEKPHGSRQERHQEERVGRRRGWPPGSGDRRGESARGGGVAGDHRIDRRRTSEADAGEPATPVPGQGV